MGQISISFSKPFFVSSQKSTFFIYFHNNFLFLNLSPNTNFHFLLIYCSKLFHHNFTFLTDSSLTNSSQFLHLQSNILWFLVYKDCSFWTGEGAEDLDFSWVVWVFLILLCFTVCNRKRVFFLCTVISIWKLWCSWCNDWWSLVVLFCCSYLLMIL